MKETTVVLRVGRMFKEKGLLVKREVPLGTKRIDLVALDPHSKQVTAVEAKVDDWRAGLRQAVIYRICANRVYIAVDKRFVQRLDLGTIGSYGIGAIVVDGVAEVILKASPSSIVHRGLLRQVRDSFPTKQIAEALPVGRT
jgi:hypothetical protein